MIEKTNIALEVTNMFCSNCGASCAESDRFCSVCGTRLHESDPVAQQSVPEAPAYVTTAPENASPAAQYIPPVYQKPRQGSLKVPTVILIVLSVIGLLLFALIPLGDSQPAPSDSGAGSLDSDECFLVIDGTLHFMEFQYSGSSELTVPEQVYGSTVIKIGIVCFSDCSKLTTVILPDSLLVIEREAFRNCTSLRGIHIPEGVFEIDQSAFSGCVALEAITLPSTLEHLGAGVFTDCESLKYVFYAGTVDQWSARFPGYFPENVTVYCSDGTLPGN